MATSAVARSSRPDAAIGAPFSVGAVDRPAANALVAHRVQHDADETPSASSQATLTANCGHPEEEVGRPVERVDHPAQLAVAGGAALLAEDRVVGAALAEHRADRRLGGLVGLGDQVGGPALGADVGLLVAEARQQLGGGGAGAASWATASSSSSHSEVIAALVVHDRAPAAPGARLGSCGRYGGGRHSRAADRVSPAGSRAPTPSGWPPCGCATRSSPRAGTRRSRRSGAAPAGRWLTAGTRCWAWPAA